ncbi:hypothetical protein POM88_025310 [Heracleum sosnowskyi]|uniref:Uncharacterized protein n=1 Tax=Heracleum sosnowskyi TaxID=360622 RepID=A0AAD8I4R9_9APIA|nr:hypothetical protein POM88_025310 [Heracleum sosnowskyi]
MIVIELIVVNAETIPTHNNRSYGNKDSACDAYCEKICALAGDGFDACYSGCLLTCHNPPKSIPDVVKKCIPTCIQSACSKYFGSDVNTLEQCMAKECIEKCLHGAPIQF